MKFYVGFSTIMLVGASLLSSAQAALPEGFKAPDTIHGIGRDDLRAQDAGRLVARRVMDAVGVVSEYSVNDFHLNGYTQTSPLGMLISRATRSEIISRHPAPAPVTHIISGTIDRLGEDAVLRVSVNRKTDGMSIPIEPILLTNMGNRSEQGIISSLKPW